MKQPPVSPFIYLPVVGFVVGGLLFFVLSALATSTSLKSQTAGIRRVADRAAALEARGGDTNPWPPGAVCRQGAKGGGDAFASRLTQLMQISKLAVLDLKVAPNDTSPADLAEVGVRLRGHGDQAATLALLRSLTRETPTLFVDRLDLKPARGGVDLDLAGRFWCWRKS